MRRPELRVNRSDFHDDNADALSSPSPSARIGLPPRLNRQQRTSALGAAQPPPGDKRHAARYPRLLRNLQFIQRTAEVVMAKHMICVLLGSLILGLCLLRPFPAEAGESFRCKTRPDFPNYTWCCRTCVRSAKPTTNSIAGAAGGKCLEYKVTFGSCGGVSGVH